MKGYDNMDIDEQVEKKNVTLYKCSNCTTSFCSFAAEDITKCPICHGSNLEANKIDEERELYYIPFQMPKKQAFKDYRRKTGMKNIEKIDKLLNQNLYLIKTIVNK